MRRLSVLAAALVLFTAACGSSSKKVTATPGAGGSTATTAANSSSGGGYDYGGGGSTATTAVPAPASGGSAITIQSFAFGPATLSVPAGTKVTVTNKDGTGHTWTSDTKAFDNPVAPGASVSFTFDQKGTFSYHCNIHPSMTGTVTVT